MAKIGIYCLGHRRPDFFVAHAKQLAKCRNQDFHFHLLSDGMSEDVLKKVKEYLGDKVTVYYFRKDPYNYMNKIFFAVDENTDRHEFSIKHDEDCFLMSESWDRLFDMANQMQENDLAATGVITNGIPTTELFLQNHAPEIKDELYADFCKIKLGFHAADYTSLNEDYEQWNPDVFYSKVKNFNHHYKGIHPVRVSFDAVKKINDFILDNFKKVMMPKNTEVIRDNSKYPYFCNGVMIIRTSEWRKIVFDRTLYVDGFDEVPLNKYRDKHKKNLLIDTGIPILHTMYNWTPNWNYENDLITKICEKAENE